MSFTKTFEQISKNDVSLAGGKGASLGEMTQAGIPVPSGFVVLSTAFERFLEETDLDVEIDAILKTVRHEEIHTVENASEKIRALIKSARMPKDIADEVSSSFAKLNAPYVAVRSSATSEDGATAAWAGQLESYLNTTKDNLLANVQKCWASLFTPRAIFYRFEKGLHKDNISVAVVVQQMVQSDVSGVGFSVHPITQDYDQIIIEAGLGLGEAIVSGQITPDSYVVHKKKQTIVDKNICDQDKMLVRFNNGGNSWESTGNKGKEQKLTDVEILKLSALITKIEKHYGFPVDVEWAMENDRMYITQSRPITTLIDNKLLSPARSSNPAPHLEYKDYQRLFQVGGMPYLISDIFMTEYKKLKGLTMLAQGTWTSYLPKDSVEKTLKEGLKLYSDKESFNEYRQGFEQYKNESEKFFKQLNRKYPLTKDKVEKFFEHASHLFYYYRRTEFFATDEAYLFGQKDKTTRENLSHLEEIKNSGREYLNKIFFGSSSYLATFLSILEKDFKIDAEMLKLYSKAETLSLFDDKRLSDSVIKGRKQAYVMNGDGVSISYLGGKEAEDLVSKFTSTPQIAQGEIKGRVANKGVAKGKAKIITADYGNFDGLKKIMEQMKKGDILIAETTSPELMPACSKAAAIVTNQGGMMSHAAIVSRELNIPCIVGTQYATEIIPDGAVIEVDADNNKVTILTR